MQKTKGYPTRNSAAELQRLARERADEQARRIPWQRLQETRNQYIDWHEFYLWVRSTLDVEDRVPDWLIETLKDRCPGFLEAEGSLTPQAAKMRPLPLRLEDWIDDHLFSFAKHEGWFNAITYNAIRDPRYQRAKVCWDECVEKWKSSGCGIERVNARATLWEVHALNPTNTSSIIRQKCRIEMPTFPGASPEPKDQNRRLRPSVLHNHFIRNSVWIPHGCRYRVRDTHGRILLVSF